MIANKETKNEENLKDKFYRVIEPLDGYTEYMSDDIQYYKSTLVNLEVYLQDEGKNPKKLIIEEINLKFITFKDIHHIKNKKKNELRDKQIKLEKERDEFKKNKLRDIDNTIARLLKEKESLKY